MLNWRNLSDLRRDTLLLADRLRHVDAIVGLPRSGMFPASILATHLHKPVGMLDPTGSLAIGGGARLDEWSVRSIALIDDSVLTGSAMNRALAAIAFAGDMGIERIETACVYWHPQDLDHVEHYAVELPAPRVFEWNLFGSEISKHSLFDIDGVLCPDPPMAEDNQREYEEYIGAAPLLFKPLFPVAAICTNRIEPYRATTEAWLAANGIEYGALHMAPFDTPPARRRLSTPIDLKSAWYAGHEHPGVLVESHDAIAEAVAYNVGRPVISMQSRRCFER